MIWYHVPHLSDTCEWLATMRHEKVQASKGGCALGGRNEPSVTGRNGTLHCSFAHQQDVHRVRPQMGQGKSAAALAKLVIR